MNQSGGQFLNSVLSSIGGEGQHVPFTQPHVRPKSAPSESKPQDRSTQQSQSIVSVTAGQKRKAEDALPKPDEKVPKNGPKSNPASSDHTSVGNQGPISMPKPSITTSNSALDVPSRGTGKASPNSTSPLTSAPDLLPKAAPKKGSYAEVMARAAASKSSQPTVGVIRHKPRETLSAKKELQLRKKGKVPDSKMGPKNFRNGTPGGKSVSPSPGIESVKNSETSDKKTLRPGYKGTATAKIQPSYKGTMQSMSTASDKSKKSARIGEYDRSRSSSAGRPHRRMDYDSEEDEDELEDQDNDSSEASDDMEAGFSDVEEEEVAAAKAAKKEDEEELRLENDRKREKEKRKKMLAAMAARAPKPNHGIINTQQELLQVFASSFRIENDMPDTPEMSPATKELLRKVRYMSPELSEEGMLGRVAVIGGSENYTGAPYFSAMASARLGTLIHSTRPPPAYVAVYYELANSCLD
ncbi:MAG: hypothetical protein Q9167_003569 [Letrouitia subvulpina]